MTSDKPRERNISAHTHMAKTATIIFLLVVEYVSVVLAEWGAYHIRCGILPEVSHIFESTFEIYPLYTYWIVPAIFIFFFHTNSFSLQGTPYWWTVRKSFWDITYSIITVVMLMYLGHVITSVSRVFVLLTGALVFLFVNVGRFWARRFMNNRSVFQIPVIFIGAGRTAEKLLASYRGDIGLGFRIIGFIDDHPASKKISDRFRILGGFDQAVRIIRLAKVSHVVICAPGISHQRQSKLVNSIQPYVESVSFVPDIMETPGNLEIVGFSDAGMMMIRVKNNLADWRNRLLKRVIDLVCCAIGMVFVLPLFAVIAVAIYVDNPGPIFFAHKRVGKGGKEFPCYKFRSMVTNADVALEKYLKENPAAREEWQRDFKLKDDPRITKVGAFLRKTSLDELPQLLNVIKGEMSLVGPRPIVRAEIEKYGEYFSDFAMVTPGITGVWQVNGRSDTTYDERVAMDSWYVHNWSPWLDLWYLVRTVKVVILREGAY